MDKKGYEMVKTVFGDTVQFDQPEDDQDLRWVGASFEPSKYCNNPAELMRRLGNVGLVPNTYEGGPKFVLAGQSSTYTGPQGLRFYVTLEDQCAPCGPEE